MRLIFPSWGQWKGLTKPWKILCLCFLGSDLANPLFLSVPSHHKGTYDFKAITFTLLLCKVTFYIQWRPALEGLNCGWQSWLPSHILTLIAADSAPKSSLLSHCITDAVTMWNKEIEPNHACCLTTVRMWMMPRSVERLLSWRVLSSLMSSVFSSSKLSEDCTWAGHSLSTAT